MPIINLKIEVKALQSTIWR